MFNKLILSIVFLSLSFLSNSSESIHNKDFTITKNDFNDKKAFKYEMLTLVNQLRKNGCKCGRKRMRPVPTVRWNDLLERAALNHAKDMTARQFFEHKGSNGSSISERIEKTGYNWQAVGENIFRGEGDAEEVFKTWKESVQHCKNMMDKDYQEMGVAKDGQYWVQDFGTSF